MDRDLRHPHSWRPGAPARSPHPGLCPCGRYPGDPAFPRRFFAADSRLRHPRARTHWRRSCTVLWERSDRAADGKSRFTRVFTFSFTFAVTTGKLKLVAASALVYVNILISLGFRDRGRALLALR